MFRIGSVPGASKASLTLMMLCAVLVACDDDSTPVEQEATTSALILPESGGSVEHTDGSKITIPANSLPAGDAISISIGVTDGSTKPDGALGDVWKFGPSGTTFRTPVTIELPFDLGNRDPRRYKVAWTKLGNESEFEDLPTTFSDGKAKAQVTHFSLGTMRELPSVPVECDLSKATAVDTDNDSIPDTCRCRSGFTESDNGCADLDECLTDNGGCDPRAECTNLVGSVTCGACPAGWSGSGADGCEDIDECANDHGGCDLLASCTNLEGSFKCEGCPAGFLGGGQSGCSDLDECLTNNGGCDKNAKCENIAGSVLCGDCPTGFTGSGNGVCVPPASDKEITSFILGGVAGVIDPDSGTITVKVPYKAALASLLPAIEYIGSSISPTTLQDFTQPVTYVVTAADGSVKPYTVDATKAAVNTAKKITSFKLDGVDGVFGGVDGKTITVTLPIGTLSLDGLVPEVVHDGDLFADGFVGGKISFIEHVAHDFTVEAEDGTREVYKVVVDIADAIGKTIKTFKLNGIEGIIGGVDGKSISVTLPFGTVSLDALVPEILADGPVAPPSGDLNGAINFVAGQAQEFTVGAGEQATKSVYKVTANIADQGAALIKQLKIGDIEGSFSGPAKEIITVTLPATAAGVITSLSGLVPKIISEGEVTPPPGVPGGGGGTPGGGGPNIGAIDFVNGVAQKFTVTAGDQSKKVYDVVVKQATNADKLIKSFKLGDVEGIIGGAEKNLISVVMPFGTSLQDTIPKIISEGTVTANGVVGNVVDFTNGSVQKFTATAYDGSTKVYDVTVDVAGSAGNLIHALRIGDIPGTFSGAAQDIITVTLPYANNLLGLVPTIVSDAQATSTALVNGKINFTNGLAQDLVVKSNDGISKTYKVIVNSGASADNLIKELKIGDAVGVFSGPTNKIITVVVDFGNTLLQLAPEVVTEGAWNIVGLVNGKIDFTNGVAKEITVTADNGAKRTYDLIVKAPNEAAKLIHALDIDGVPGEFSGLANEIITVVLPFGKSLDQLVPNITSDGTVTAQGFVDGKVDLVDGVAKDFVVKAHDNSEKTYKLIVKNALDSSNIIQSLKIGDAEGVFSGPNNNIITTTLPFGTALQNLVPKIVSGGTVTGPNLSNGVLSLVEGVSSPLTVTAHNGDKKVYDLIAKTALNNDNTIKSFKIGDVDGVFSGANLDTITATLPYQTVLSGISPKIDSPGKVTLNDLPVGLVNFVADAPKVFKVTAANDAVKNYNVIVKTALGSANSIQSFKLNGFPGVINGQNIDVTAPFGTLPIGLKPSILHDGKALTADGLLDGLIDFVPGIPKPFVVEAADGAKKTYNVNLLIESLQQANEIKKFELLGQAGEIDEIAKTITVKFPTNRNLSNVLVPPVVLSNGATVVKSLGTNNFNNPVEYTAYARDGRAQKYVLKIVNPPG